MADSKIILRHSDEAAQYTTVRGWVSSTGQFFGNDEHTARWAGCTHQTCDCGVVIEKGSLRCRSCEAKYRTEQYYALPAEDWDGITPITLWREDRYFFHKEDFMDFLFHLKKDHPGELPEVQPVLCTPGSLGLIDADNWADDLAEDGELPDAVAQKVEELNQAIRASGPVSWWEGKIRINVEPLWAELAEQSNKEQVVGSL